MSRYFSKRFENLEAYVPGEQPKDMQYVKLNTNESPYPPSQKVLDSVNKEEVQKLCLYPDPECTTLREKIANLYGVKKENIILGNGSDEILSFIFMSYCDAQTGVVFPEISYGFYKVFAELYSLSYNALPLENNLSIDNKKYFATGKTVVIANPNAPTGLSLSLEQIEEIIKHNKDNVVVIDEAYVDFGGKTCYNLIEKYDNLIVVQTFSKSRSLAGARLGFAIANEKLIDDLEKIRYSTNPYNINHLSLIAGCAAVDDNDYYMNNCKKIIETRTFTSNELSSLGFNVINSDANFVFAKHSGYSGEDLYLKLKEKGILVRHFSKKKIEDYLRITIGTKEQMQILIDALKQII